MSPEKFRNVEAELFQSGEGNMKTIVICEIVPLYRGRKAILRKNRYCRNLGGLMFNHKPALVRIGKTESRSR